MSIEKAAVSTDQTLFVGSQASDGKYHRFCNWVKAHKKEIAIALVIIGIAATTFGVGTIIGLLVVAQFSYVPYVFGFFYGLFNFASSGAIVGLTVKGALFMSSIGCILGGTALWSFGRGMESAIQKP